MVCSCSGTRVCVATCHDPVYPEVAKILALKVTEVVFALALIRKGGREPWHLCLKARALENKVSIVGANMTDSPRYSEGS